MAAKKTAKSVDPVDAYLGLVTEHGFDAVGMSDVAGACGLSLSQMRDRFADPFDILKAFSKRIDAAVLDGVTDEMMEDAPRERLFDILMMRFDALLPHRAALKRIHEASARNPLVLAAWNRIAVKSQYWMLIAAGLAPKGVGGMVEAQAMVVVYARTMRVWLKDDDAGMARTMAELDRRLREAERVRQNTDGLKKGAMRTFEVLSALARGPRRRRPRHDDTGQTWSNGDPEAV